MAAKDPWSFTMELLPHVHTLRLFLLHPSISPSHSCLHLSASLLSPSPSLSCSWTSPLDAFPHSILLPLPLLLFDHSAPIRSSALLDHIEFSIQLLPLGPSHLDAFSSLLLDPVDEDIPRHKDGADSGGIEHIPRDRDGADSAGKQLTSLDRDVQRLALQGDVTFFCRNCTTKLSRKPFREVVQLPSVDWREVVEHWFGTCCCSFGSKAEFLSACYEKTLSLRPGRCLMGSTTFYIDFEDVIPDAIAELELFTRSRESSSEGQNLRFNFLALGNGFMVWANERNKSTEWVPVHCASCSFLVGAFPSKKEGSGSVVQGIHFFKCQISIGKVDGSLCDTYRYLTLQNMLAKELGSRTEENSSYRFFIRGLSSKLPLLQLVVLSYESSICMGSCTESHCSGAVETSGGCSKPMEEKDVQSYKSSGEAFGVAVDYLRLKPIVKLMFLDCSGFTSDEIRVAEQWAQEHDAENIYMLEEVAEALKNDLIANSHFFPASCVAFQSFHFSFLDM